MLEPTDLLLAQIQAERPALVSQTTERLRVEVPWFQRLPAAIITGWIEEDIAALNQLLTAPDGRAARQQVTAIGSARIRAGAPATDLIAAASILAEEVQALILRAFDDPSTAGAASRRLQSATKNIRMILSGVNLQMLMDGIAGSSVSASPY